MRIKTAILAAFCCLSGTSTFASTYTISGDTDSYSAVGDFTAITGSSAAASPGQVLSLLELSKDKNGNETATASYNM